jgi:hypothetical protein
MVSRTPSLRERAGSGSVMVFGARYRTVPGSDICGEERRKQGGRGNQQS